MANNTITVTYKINEDGSLQKISKNADKAAASTDKATKSQSKFNKGQKGVAGSTSNGTKAFSKMRSEMGGSSGVVAAYATFAANVFALTAAFGALQRAAQLQNLETGFAQLANAVGRTTTLMASSIQNLTDGAISFDQAMRVASTGFSAGMTMAEIEGLTKVARGASTALGRNLPDALDRLVRGTAKLEPEILDELGIFVKIDDAVRQYATSLGKSAVSLTATERRAAFLNATLEQGKKKFGAIADSVDVNVYDQLASNLDRIGKTALNLFSNILAPVISFLSNNTMALVGVMVLFASTLAKSMFPALGKMAEKQHQVADASARMAGEAAKEGKTRAQQAKIGFVKGPSKAKTKSGEDFKAVTNLKKQLKKGTQQAGDYDKALRSIQATITKTDNIAKKNKLRGTKAHKKRIAELKAQKKQIKDVRAAEKGRGASAGDSAFRLGDAKGQKSISESLDNMEGMGAADSFKEARSGFAKYRVEHKAGMGEFKKGSKFWPKMGKSILGGFKLGGVGVRIFGAALINAIPLIGQIIFVIGLAIQLLGALWRAFTKPTESEKRLAEITDKLKDKIVQLNETNGKLEAGFIALNIEQAITRAGTTGLTDDMIDSAIATAELQTKTTKFANELAVASGVIGEYASSIGILRTELVKEGGEGGIIAATGNALDAMGDGISGAASSVWGGIVDGWNATAAGVNTAATAISDTVTDVVGATGDLIAGDKSASKALEMAGVKGNIKTFRDSTVDNFSDIKDQLEKAGMGEIIKTAFDGKPLEEFVDGQLANIDMTQSSEKAQAQFERVMARVQARISAGAIILKKHSDAINSFGENVSDATSSLRKFVTANKDSNKYTKLGVNVQDVTNSVIALQEAAEASAGRVTFAELLQTQIESGTINLGEMGTTFAEVIASFENVKEGEVAAPFSALATAVKAAADEMQNGKSIMKAMKTELKELQATFAQGLKDDKFKQSLDNLKKFGKFEVGQLDKNANAKNQYEDRITFLGKEETIKNRIAAQEVKMAQLNIAILKLQNPILDAQGNQIAGNVALHALYGEQLAVLTAQVSAAEALNLVQKNAGITAAKSTFYTDQESNIKAVGTAAGTGDTTAERAQNFDQAGGFGALDRKAEDGSALTNDAGDPLTNIGGKMAAVTAQMQPMIDMLKSLGPDGELVAAISAGALAMGEAFGTLSDKISAGTATTADKLAAAGAAIGAIAGMLAASSKAKIAGIDQEISAEKKRDGKSAASVAKIKSMEKKKEAMAKKAFEVNKKMQIAGAIISTASAVMGALGSKPWGTWNIALAAMMGAMGAAQVAIISGTSFQGGGSAPDASAPSAITMGERSNTVDLGKANNAGGELAYMRGASGQGTGATDYKPTPAFAGYNNRAGGGYIVGEQGPEVFMPDTAGSIIPSGQGIGGSTNVSFNIQAIDASGVEDVLIAQKGQIIRMIREAANEHGEFFLENVREEAYQK